MNNNNQHNSFFICLKRIIISQTIRFQVKIAILQTYNQNNKQINKFKSFLTNNSPKDL